MGRKDLLDCIVCGDCRDLVRELEPASVDALLIDPPYGAGLVFAEDTSPGAAADLLAEFLSLAHEKVKVRGHIAVFWTFRHLDTCLDVIRGAGFDYVRALTMYLPKGGARPYLGWLPRTQAVLIGQRGANGGGEYHSAVAVYLNAAMKAAKFTRLRLASKLRCNSRLVMKWTRVGDPFYCLPTPRFYSQLKRLLKLDSTHDELLDEEVAAKRRGKRHDFEFKHDCYVVKSKKGRLQHPAEKPLGVVRHIVTCITPRGGVVLDGFAGSGTTAVAAKTTGRHFICFELSGAHCKVARQRVARVCAGKWRK